MQTINGDTARAAWSEAEASLVEECLQRLDGGDPGAVRALEAEHPQHAALFEHVRSLLVRLQTAVQAIEPSRAGPASANGGSHSQLVGLDRPEIPGFEIRREIGRGGMGVVFEALELSTRRRVALKLIPVRDGHATLKIACRPAQAPTSTGANPPSDPVPPPGTARAGRSLRHRGRRA